MVWRLPQLVHLTVCRLFKRFHVVLFLCILFPVAWIVSAISFVGASAIAWHTLQGPLIVFGNALGIPVPFDIIGEGFDAIQDTLGLQGVGALGIWVFVGTIVSLVLAAILNAWSYAIADALAKNDVVFSVRKLQDSFNIAPFVCATSILYYLSIYIPAGILAGVLWGVYLPLVPIAFLLAVFIAISGVLFPYVLIQKKQMPLEALSRSYKLMRGHHIVYLLFLILAVSIVAVMLFMMLNIFGFKFFHPAMLAVQLVVLMMIYLVVNVTTAMYYYVLSDQEAQIEA